MRIPIKGLGEVGYIADQEGYELAPNALSELQNMRMRAGWAERVRGHYQIGGNLPFVPYLLAGYATTATKYLLEAGLRTMQADDGTNRSVITPATALTMNSGNKWTSALLNGYLILNNQADVPLSWSGDPASVAVALVNWNATFRAKAVRTVRYHVVAMNVTEAGVNYAHRVRISAAAEPGTLPTSFDASDATVDADVFDILGDGVLVDGLLMGETLMVYKEHSVSALRYSPSNVSAFDVQPLPFRFGMLSQNCGVDVPGIGHVILTNGDVVRFDGTIVQSIVEQRTRDWLFAQMDTDWYAMSFVVANYQKSEVWICFPEMGNQVCTKALVWNYQSDTFSKRDLPNATCGCTAVLNYAIDRYDSDSVSFDSESALTFNSGNSAVVQNNARTFIGTSSNEVFLMDLSDTADGASFTSYIERTGLDDIGVQQLVGRKKNFNRLWLQIDAPAGTPLTVYLGASDNPEVAPTYDAGTTFTVGTDRWVDSWASGVFLAYKISATGTAFWRARSIFPEVSDAGAY